MIACGYHNFVQYHEGPPCKKTRQKQVAPLGPEPRDENLERVHADRKAMLASLEKFYEPALVIHVVPEQGARMSYCKRTKGRVTHDPVAATPFMRKQDRFCSLCWNRWAKERAA
jgi:hypothetical protein